MDLCEQFDLRFVTIADRFFTHLKNAYDLKQIKEIKNDDIEDLCKTAVDPLTRKPISEQDKTLIRKRDQKTIQKHLVLNKIDEDAFDRTVEEIKYRYYEVARALLIHRN